MSTFKNILVHVDDRQTAGERLEQCIALARKYGARVTGLYVGTFLAQNLLVDAPPSGMLIEALETEQRERTERARSLFEQKTAGADVACEFHVEEGSPVHWLASYAGYADIVVVGRTYGDDSLPGTGGVAGDLVLACGRPVLAVPGGGARSLSAERILIAWNGSREAARAVNDARPFLDHAVNVEVVTVEPGTDASGGGAGGAELCRYLSRHGIKATPVVLPSAKTGVAEALLAQAEQTSADLVVLGAYGHSRLRELVLGGVTRHLLKHATLPLLLSH